MSKKYQSYNLRINICIFIILSSILSLFQDKSNDIKPQIPNWNYLKSGKFILSSKPANVSPYNMPIHGHNINRFCLTQTKPSSNGAIRDHSTPLQTASNRQAVVQPIGSFHPSALHTNVHIALLA